MTRPLPTVEEVQAAYEQLKPLGVGPTRGAYVRAVNEIIECCSLGAVYFAEGVEPTSALAIDPGPMKLAVRIAAWVGEQFGWDTARAFTNGFDGSESPTPDDLRTAYEHGRAVARAVFGDDERAGGAG